MIHNINELYIVKGQYGIYELEAVKNLPFTQVRQAGARPYGKTIKVIQADGSKKLLTCTVRKLGRMMKKKSTATEKRAKRQGKKPDVEWF